MAQYCTHVIHAVIETENQHHIPTHNRRHSDHSSSSSLSIVRKGSKVKSPPSLAKEDMRQTKHCCNGPFEILGPVMWFYCGLKYCPYPKCMHAAVCSAPHDAMLPSFIQALGEIGRNSTGRLDWWDNNRNDAELFRGADSDPPQGD